MPSKPTLTYRQKQILDYIKEKIKSVPFGAGNWAGSGASFQFYRI